jgi:GTP cyclohydrolase I
VSREHIDMVLYESGEKESTGSLVHSPRRAARSAPSFVSGTRANTQTTVESTLETTRNYSLETRNYE